MGQEAAQQDKSATAMEKENEVCSASCTKSLASKKRIRKIVLSMSSLDSRILLKNIYDQSTLY